MSITRTRCPSCSGRIAVVAGRDNARIHCPGCNAELTVVGDRVGLSPAEMIPSKPARGATTTAASTPDSQGIASPVSSRKKPPPARGTSRSSSVLRGVKPSVLVAAIGGLAVMMILIGVAITAFSRIQANTAARYSADDREEPQDPNDDVAYWRKEADRLAKEAEEAQLARIEAEREAAAQRHSNEAAEPRNSTKSDDGDDPIKKALLSVAVVKLPHGHGSGFMAADRTLVTNYHVIEKGRIKDVQVGFPDNPSVRDRLFPVELIDEDPGNDLAILRVACDVPALTVDGSYTHVNGQKVVAIGSPGTGGTAADMIANLTTDGRLGPEYPLPNGSKLWTMSMPINAGNSGGPILDARTGNVIGVVVAKFTRTESQSLAVPLPRLAEALQRAGSATPTEVQLANVQHRARFCLAHMAELVRLAELSFAKSCEAAASAEEETDDAMLAAFNEFKSDASQTLSDVFTNFETTVTAEVRALRNDPACDSSVRLALEKLHQVIEEQVLSLRRSVPRDEIEHFVRNFRESLTRAKSLAGTVARPLRVELLEDDE